MIYWSVRAHVAALLVCHLPALTILRMCRSGDTGLLAYSLLGALFGVVPTAAVVLRLGGRLRDLLSPEAMQFLILFAFAGAIFGLGYAWTHRQASAPAPRGFEPVVKLRAGDGNP